MFSLFNLWTFEGEKDKKDSCRIFVVFPNDAGKQATFDAFISKYDAECEKVIELENPSDIYFFSSDITGIICPLVVHTCHFGVVY